MCGLPFDLSNAINIFVGALLGAILGGPISFAVSRHFFFRGKDQEKLTQWLSHNLGEAFTKSKSPQFFGPQANYIPINKPSVTPDTPRLEFVSLYPSRVSKGQTLQILCRVIDKGWNFPSPGGLFISYNNVKRGVQNVGFGYMIADIPIPTGATSGLNLLKFDMSDLSGNTNSETVDFEVI